MIGKNFQPGQPAFGRAAATRLKAFLADRSGGALIWFGLTIPVVLGSAGIGVDLTLWYMDRRIIQTASDTGAIAGAHALNQGYSNTEITQLVKDEIARNDFAADANDDIAVNIPPKFGPNKNVAGFVEVIITKQRTNYLSRILGQDTTNIQARAVGGGGGAGEHCVLALDRNADGAVNFAGTAVTDINCGVASNSRSANSIDLNGGSLVDVDYLESHGDIEVNSNSTLNSDVPPKPYSNYVKDPYAYLTIPTEPSACLAEADAPAGLTLDAATGVWKVSGGTVTLNPARYCGGLAISGGATVTFNAGLYIFDAGEFRVSGNSTVNGDGVTFVLTATAAADIGVVWFAGGTVANLAAPIDEADPYVGVLIFIDPREVTEQVKIKGVWTEQPVVQTSKLLGGTTMDLIGAVYTPSQDVQFTGGLENGNGCTLLVAKTVNFSGNTNIVNSEQTCADYRVKMIAITRVVLLE